MAQAALKSRALGSQRPFTAASRPSLRVAKLAPIRAAKTEDSQADALDDVMVNRRTALAGVAASWLAVRPAFADDEPAVEEQVAPEVEAPVPEAEIPSTDAVEAVADAAGETSPEESTSPASDVEEAAETTAEAGDAPAADESAEAETSAEAAEGEASENAQEAVEGSSPETIETSSSKPTGRPRLVYLDVKIEKAVVGRITVELFDDVKVGSDRFADLAEGREGVGYRLKRIDGIFETHLRVEGVKSLSYSATQASPITGGDSTIDLEVEMEEGKHKHSEAGLVSLVVKEEKERPVQEKLIAKNGRLVTVQNQIGEAPNGTSFMITRGAAPALDATNLVVGRVVSGMDVVEQVAMLPYSRPRQEWYDGPFFQAGKALGDKRADVAEKGFNRPFKRVIIAKSGLLDE
mmetsp:Transcript_26657/g.58131  ORF Transcript_26657/g.58131 Transcript_26657/m.58131 type:complete len:407 (-) Transcript_26657:1429-2649(-)|eukprot:CAMPEP_0202919796 /NCGR_PEP_ID=MMETSP1392-20130828/76519_1 /ASSEMBLY_ACC=CAM_ASM_000868 /TAXON_ID=225041 /ORGANISM="Chlamydomonas chlamydogama, Strain SAG 11-48b" /LENGTH=406 /DNA_ID=CAMNT_0049613255 /DNA_START=44 /DNA_END=1264 /DNA_ORIENTATION=+